MNNELRNNVQKDNIIRKLFEYSLLLALIKISGGARYEEYYSLKLVILLAVSFIYMIFQHRKLGYLQKSFVNNTFVVIVMALCIFIVPAINNSDKFGTYFGVFFQILIGFFVALSFERDKLKDKYINLIVFLSVFSLIGFAMCLFAPNLITKLPIYDGLSPSYKYFDAFFFVVPVSRGYAAGVNVLLLRNSGLCWEPGCFQAFVNLALLFFLDGCYKKLEKKRQLQVIAVLILTIITTFSVTGILIMAIIVAFRWNNFIDIFSAGVKKNKKEISFLTFVVFGGAGIAAYFKSSVSSKVKSILNNSYGYSLTYRLDLDRIKYIFVSPEGGINFFGLSFETSEKYFPVFFNSIIHSAVCLGVIFTAIVLFLHIKAGRKLVSVPWLYFVTLIISFCSEGLLYKALFMAFTFSGCLMTRKDIINESTIRNC